MTFSRRLPSSAVPNGLTRTLEQLRTEGAAVADLTESNPTRAGIAYPSDLLTPLGDPGGLVYDPHPFGMSSARSAVAADQSRRGVLVDPAHVVLTASTSEAYSWLFKLLCDPGECVLVPRPSYPLFEHLTRLEGIRAEPYDLEYGSRWQIDVASLRAAPDDARAVLVVSPNNPTGSYVTPGELEELGALCCRRGWALIADEVFADYPLDAVDPLTDLASKAGCLAFTLAGLSKSLGLPQLKLGWMIAGGPREERDSALRALEHVADSFLSVGTPVQLAAPALFTHGAAVRQAIRDRVRSNLACLRSLVSRFPACEVLRTEGGWSAVVRVPAIRAEEQLVVDLLSRDRILVHPGYFFDFPHEAYIIVSLLVPADIFAGAMPRVLGAASS